MIFPPTTTPSTSGLSLTLAQAMRERKAPARAFFATPLDWARHSVLSTQWPGIPRAALVEWCGAQGVGKTDLLLDLWQTAPQSPWLWIEAPQDANFSPVAWARRGISLSNGWCVETTPQPLGWILLQALRSQAFTGIVVSERLAGAWGVEGRPEHVTQLRRLQIAAERSEASVFFLREQPSRAGTWPLAMQASVTRSLTTLQPRIQVQKFYGSRFADSLTPSSPSEVRHVPLALAL